MASSWTTNNLWQSLLFCIVIIAKCYAKSNHNEGCSMVKHAYSEKGFTRSDVPHNMIPGENLRICPQGLTCCTREMEQNLNKKSREDYDKLMGEKISILRNTFIHRTIKFDEFFSALLENSKSDLHNMFVKTYGLLYQQNSHVFTDLYDDLKDYYNGKNINLLDALDNFFSTLLQKMFVLLNVQYNFDENYLQCVSEKMDELKPFGDIPQKLSIQVKRAFIAARTFVQGLAIGRDVILGVSKLEPTQSCSNALMKMMYCPYCRGLPQVQPCNNYCMNVMKGCLAYHADLNHEWNNYINALMKVADRLEGPFNIESVVDPIDVKISEAIMNFQENSDVVSKKVFQECGEPEFGRNKRSADEAWKYDRYQTNVRPTTAAGTSLDRLVKDIRQKVEVAKDIWKSLPHSICNQIAAPLDEVNNCWNGLGKSRYMPEVMRDGVAHQNNNPEVDVDVRKPNSAINGFILKLQLITTKLKNAHNGLDVDWIDNVDGTAYGSGGGGGSHSSGGGSGGDMDDGSGYSGGGYRYGKDRADDQFSFQSTYRPVIITRRPQDQRPHSDNSASNLSSSYLVMVVLAGLFTYRWLH